MGRRSCLGGVGGGGTSSKSVTATCQDQNEEMERAAKE